MFASLRHFLGWLAGLRSAETQTTPAERACLARHAQGRARLAEIGVWHGVNTTLFRRVMDPHGTLYAIDPFPVGRLVVSFPRIIARAEVRRVSRGTVTWLRTTGVKAAAHMHQPVDFVFIDGDHSAEGLTGDWQAWCDLIAPGGIVALHDSRSTCARPIDGAGSVLVTNNLILRDPRFEVVETTDSLTVLTRRKGGT